MMVANTPGKGRHDPCEVDARSDTLMKHQPVEMQQMIPDNALGNCS